MEDFLFQVAVGTTILLLTLPFAVGLRRPDRFKFIEDLYSHLLLMATIGVIAWAFGYDYAFRQLPPGTELERPFLTTGTAILINLGLAAYGLSIHAFKVIFLIPKHADEASRDVRTDDQTK